MHRDSTAPQSTVAGTLSARVFRGLRWKILSQVLQQVSRVGVAIVVAHLLTPRDFGLAAMALVFSGVATLFTDVALGAALIQREKITDADRSTVFWTQVGLGLAVTAVGVALAPAAAAFFSTPAVAPYFAATASIGVIASLGLTQTALLLRDMQFRSLELREMTGTVIAAAAGLALAIAGFGAWAIVGQTIVFATVSSVLVWRLSPWRPTLVYHRQSLRELGPFGAQVLATRLLSYLNLNMDNVLIGRYLGAPQLGTYSVAYNVMFVPIARVAQPVQQVLFPAFAQMQHDPVRLGRAWLRGTRVMATISGPAFIGMAVVAPDFVPLVLGNRWHAAVPVLQLLSAAGFLQSFQSLNPAVLQGLGRAGLLLRFMTIATVVVVGSFILGLVWGIVGVAALFAIARGLQLAGYTWIMVRVTKLRLGDILADFARVSSLALGVGAGALAARLGMLQTGAGPTARLLAALVVGGALYAGIIIWRQREILEQVRGILRRDVAPPPETAT